VQTTTAGATVSYSVSVRNNDTSDCANTTFALGASVPSGWAAGYDRASVTVTPGTTAVALLNVTPSLTATGTSSFTSSVARSGSAGPGGSTTGSVLVSTPVTSIDVTVSASISRASIQMSATVRSSGAPVAGAAVTFRVTDPQGSARTVSATTNASGVASGSLKLRPKDPKGTYSSVATATASGMTVSASTTVVN
jgi:outer membrane usher protein FimD/PapC